jgi:hypothetical protein
MVADAASKLGGIASDASKSISEQILPIDGDMQRN